LLGCSPLLETSLVDIVAACGSAPDNCFICGIEFHEADGTVTIDLFPVAGWIAHIDITFGV